MHTPDEILPGMEEYPFDIPDKWSAWWDINREYMTDSAFVHMRRRGINYVPGRGNMDPGGILFVGEAPGNNENEQVIPFVGRAGEIWEELLHEIDLVRVDVYVTNVIKYQPLGPTNRDPTPYEILHSLPYLTREVNLINPKVIVPMGRFATRAFYPGRAAHSTRGKVFQRRGRHIAPIYHPAAAGYNRALRPKLEKQFRVIGSLLE